MNKKCWCCNTNYAVAKRYIEKFAQSWLVCNRCMHLSEQCFIRKVNNIKVKI